MESKKTVAILTVLMMVSSCSLIPSKKEVSITTKAIERTIIQPIMPREIDLKEPYWYVVSDKNIDEFLARIEKDQGQIVFFAMSVPDYELMAYNMQELKRYINELKEVVVYYRKVTVPKSSQEEKPNERKISAGIKNPLKNSE
jgi:hypothetical protein